MHRALLLCLPAIFSTACQHALLGPLTSASAATSSESGTLDVIIINQHFNMRYPPPPVQLLYPLQQQSCTARSTPSEQYSRSALPCLPAFTLLLHSAAVLSVCTFMSCDTPRVILFRLVDCEGWHAAAGLESRAAGTADARILPKWKLPATEPPEIVSVAFPNQISSRSGCGSDAGRGCESSRYCGSLSPQLCTLQPKTRTIVSRFARTCSRSRAGPREGGGQRRRRRCPPPPPTASSPHRLIPLPPSPPHTHHTQ